MYAHGQGVAKDAASVIAWYSKAFEGGKGEAALELAELYEAGQGVPQDYTAARAWYGKAVDLPNGWALFKLGQLAAEGKGGPQDYKEATEWYYRAAKGGQYDAMSALAQLLVEGKGVEKDEIEAHALLSFAVQTKDATRRAAYQKRLDLLTGRLTPVQIAAAKKLLEEITDDIMEELSSR
jgi:TPR repeat protein